jgi:hypothetical protein
MAIIWNYEDRIPRSGASAVHKTEARVILNTVSLISMQTNKSKSQPAGSFEIRLAPTFNWVTRITVGSWIALLMSPNQDILPTTNVAPGFLDPRTFKMLGRIESVRMVVSVDQNTGARQTEYVVSGSDWAQVFNTKLYIDPIARNNNLDQQPETGHAARLILGNAVKDWSDRRKLPSSGEVTQLMINLWGDPLAALKDAFSQSAPNLLLSSGPQYTIPGPVAIWCGLTNEKKIPSIKMADAINLLQGKLSGYDKYGGDPNEGQGFPDPASLYGINTFWQVLTDNCNPTINELVADIRFDTPLNQLTLYKRVKPFVTSNGFSGPDPKLVSKFKDIKRINVPYEEVISINAGTNYRDKVNFVEILPQPQRNQATFDLATKKEGQTKDLDAIGRDGFRPLIERARYLPYQGSEPAPIKAAQEWKQLLREWYFSAHNMLNGSMRIIGRDEYISVGDNVMVSSKVFGAAPFNKAQSDAEAGGNETFLLAHIENVSHTFTVDEMGARSFITTIQFSRGVITDASGKVLDPSGDAIDHNATQLYNEGEKNIHDTFGWSGESDPDIQKLRGT